MKRTRTLTLRGDRLGDLGAAELADVAGGTHFCTVTHTPICQPPTLPIAVCLSEAVTVCVCIQTG